MSEKGEGSILSYIRLFVSGQPVMRNGKVRERVKPQAKLKAQMQTAEIYRD